jgi:hypothetical protein
MALIVAGLPRLPDEGLSVHIPSVGDPRDVEQGETSGDSKFDVVPFFGVLNSGLPLVIKLNDVCTILFFAAGSTTISCAHTQKN